MRSNQTISIFDSPIAPVRAASSVWISVVAHSAALAGMSYGMLHDPAIRDSMLRERYSVRHLDLRAAEPRAGRGDTAKNDPAPSAALAEAKAPDETPAPDGADATAPRPDDAGKPEPESALAPQGPRTLVQPEFHVHMSMAEETPLPTLMIWTPEQAASPRIVPPAPEEATAANVHPSLSSPNEEAELTDLSIARSDAEADAIPLQPGSSSPVEIDDARMKQMPPSTVTNVKEQPTPTAVLSVSDARMAEGTVVLPPVDEARMPSPHPELAPRTRLAKADGPPDVLHADRGAAAGTAAVSGDAAAGAAAAGAENAETAESGMTHIELPQNGRFGVVVVGTSLADQYPETQQIWRDRIAYTTYLHVGLSKNWILQYSQLRSAEAASNGEVARLEAPWPYDIYRPTLVSRELNADALMVHGVVNEAGRFESLAIAFPTEYEHAALVLLALRRWQFRPARQNGRATAVEVLLVIPDELD